MTRRQGQTPAHVAENVGVIVPGDVRVRFPDLVAQKVHAVADRAYEKNCRYGLSCFKAKAAPEPQLERSRRLYRHASTYGLRAANAFGRKEHSRRVRRTLCARDCHRYVFDRRTVGGRL